MRPFVLTLLTLALAGCGGGGGGGSNPPAQTAPRLLGNNVETPDGAGTLPLALGGSGTRPTLLQFDLVFNPALVTFQPEVRPDQTLGVATAEEIEPGRVRVIVGDATTRDAPPALATGALLRVPFELGITPALVTIDGVIAAGPDGQEIPFDGVPFTLRLSRG